MPEREGQIDAVTGRGLIIDTATANPHSFGLLGNGQLMVTVNHRFTLSNPDLVSAPSKKSFPGEFTNFGVQRFNINRRFIG